MASRRGFAIEPGAATGLLVRLALLIALCPVPAFAQAFQEQTSIVVAFVTDSAGNPISGADVQIVGTSLRGNTDEAGRVALLAVPVGKATLRVRRLGFGESTIQITVTPGATPDVRSRLRPVAANLKKVVVRSDLLKPDRYAKTGRFDEFYRRRATGSGTFLTREDIDARRAQKPEDLVRMATGVRIRYRGMVPYIQFLRCEQVNVFIDGIRAHDGFRDYLSLNPLEIEAMEIYHGLAAVPPQFSPRPNDCAAIVVWTRWHGAQQ
ncbi:MAG TPA: carboxypeptidase regulatory-like domain-containing protein [Gemmatimonadaceae bacterium]|nr:carboxypeptidase regulatory-like domain-containing protein [Gemmatimonadaceae bacterium]